MWMGYILVGLPFLAGGNSHLYFIIIIIIIIIIILLLLLFIFPALALVSKFLTWPQEAGRILYFIHQLLAALLNLI